MTPSYFTTLDGRKVPVSTDETISPKTVKVVPNEGMPTANKTGRGSLYIKFDIIFPTAIDTDCLNIMLSALKSNEIELEL
jgi:DnaJ homolog subfamily B member 4